MWCSGRQHSQRSVGATPIRTPAPIALHRWLPYVSSTAVGSPAVPDVWITQCTSIGVEVVARSRCSGAPARRAPRPWTAPPARGRRASSRRSVSGAGASGSSGTATAPSFVSACSSTTMVGGRLQQQGHPVAPLDPRAREPAGRRRAPRSSSSANDRARSPAISAGRSGQRLGGAREPVVNSHVAWWVGICERLSCAPAWISAGLPQASYTDIRYEKGAA